MAGWTDRVEELLYEGETVDEQVEVGESTVVVTSHRVLAFTPSLDGKNFREAQRPNVTGACIETTADSRFLSMGLRIALYGVVLLGVGLFVDFGAIIGGVDLAGEGTQQLGIGNVLGMVQGMISLIGRLDFYMRVIGALLVAFALVPLGVYAWSREQFLVLEVAGEDSIRVASPEAGGAELEALRAALLPEGVPVEDAATGHLESLNPFQ